MYTRPVLPMLENILQGYKDIYSPVIFKCTQEFVLVTFQLYSALTNRQNVTISHV